MSLTPVAAPLRLAHATAGYAAAFAIAIFIGHWFIHWLAIGFYLHIDAAITADYFSLLITIVVC